VKPSQRSFRRLLNIGFVCRCCTQRNSEVREGTQEASARFGGTPAHAGIETAIAVGVLDGQRSLTHTTHALHRRAAHRCLRHGSGLAAVATSREGHRSPRSGVAASKALIIFNFRSPSASIDVLTHVPRGAA
jgi:hypothetical protein